MKYDQEYFKDLLNKYLNILNCSAKDLSDASNVSPSIISRYRSGEKTPKEGNNQVTNIINGIIKIMHDKNIDDIDEDIIKEDFKLYLTNEIDYEIFKTNLNLLFDSLNINAKEMSKFLGYDPSYLSKIRSGVRKPTYINDFINSITKYILLKYNDIESIKVIKMLLNKTDLNDEDIHNELIKWLTSSSNIKNNDAKIKHFLNELDKFDLNDYIKVIHFDELKVPTTPINLPKSKFYYGLEEMKNGELDFLKSVVLDKNSKNVFMCSDMPMEDMSIDLEFNKKWRLGIAMMLKKGIKLNIIHNLNRPFNEMMLGLEGWIPIYMTGQVTPYYLKNYNPHIYFNLNYISEDYALSGECIANHHNKGKYYLTNNKKEVEYYKNKAKYLFERATPLMNIITDNQEDKLKEIYIEDTSIKGNRKRLSSTLPIHTLSDELIDNIISKSNLSKENIKEFKDYINKEKSLTEIILKDNIVIDEITKLDKDAFYNNHNYLNLKYLNKDIIINYSYEDYLKHFELTKKYKNNNYRLIINDKVSFNNIDIYINSKNYCIISKSNKPRIHFVIRHEKLLNAIENFMPLIIDKE